MNNATTYMQGGFTPLILLKPEAFPTLNNEAYLELIESEKLIWISAFQISNN